MIMIMDGALQAVDHSCYESAILEWRKLVPAGVLYYVFPQSARFIAPSVLITGVYDI